MQDIHPVINSFAIEGELLSVKANKSGHINSTYIATFSDGQKYTIQRVNRAVFPKPQAVMQNIHLITSHIQQKVAHLPDTNRRCLSLVPSKTGEHFSLDNDGELWRAYRYIDEVDVFPFLEDAELAYRFGEAVGTFQAYLADFPAAKLSTTIEKFHHMGHRYSQLKDAIHHNLSNRLSNVEAEVSYLLTEEKRGMVLTNALESGAVPLRVTHNDTKISNILFDKHTKEGLCMIDLDTVMGGTILFDTGDMLRTGCITASEDEQDLKKVHCDAALFTAMLEGYSAKAGSFLTETETLLLAESGRATTQIMAVRFLTDYLNGDVYYHIEHPTHNLDRARTQITLMQDMDRKWEGIMKALS
ncbi:MAG: phosphotransferase [Sphaerochaeta sp.]|nr:phosphotransferase [Sphaerochaeta sp.]